MRQFLKYVLATMVAMVLFTVLFILLVIGMAASVSKSNNKPETIAANSVLKVNLNYAIPEKSSENQFSNFDLRSLKAKKAVGLNDIVACIRRAAVDDNIKGIYLEMGTPMTGWATIEAIRNVLQEFKKSGKFIYAYGDVASQKGYYLATAANQVFLNPNGILEFKGMGVQIMYYKGALEKLGVEVQDFHCGAFKSAIEPYLRDKMSEPNREQLTVLLGDMYQHFLGNIAADRHVEKEVLNHIADSILAESPQRSKALGLVDDNIYYDQLLTKIGEKVGKKEKDELKFVELNEYNKLLQGEADKTSKNKIAIVFAAGTIVDGEGEDDNIGGDKYAALIRKLRTDDKVKAIVLRVNSPGGSALASDLIWREVILAKKAKPVVVSFGDYAASGGYYISCAADKIFSQPNTITGSIGVFGLIPNAKKMLNDKLGITTDEVKITQHGVFGGGTKPLDEREMQYVQGSVEKVYREFKERVADGRKKSVDDIEKIAQGRVWTGTQGIANGLVDSIGSLDNAIAYAAKTANLKDYRIKNYPEEKSLAEQISESFADMKTNVIKQELGENYKTYQLLKNLSVATPIQARMAFELDIK